MRILIIDDEIRRMKPTIDMLRAESHEVKQISSPTEAYQALREKPKSFELLILDIMMPADGEFDIPASHYGLRTGFLLLEKLRVIKDFNIPIIVLTANPEFEQELQNEVNCFLLKPVPFERLETAINRLTSQAQSEEGKKKR